MKRGRLLVQVAIAIAIVAAAGAASTRLNQSVPRDSFGSATPGVHPLHLDDALLAPPRPSPELAAASVRNARPDWSSRALRSVLAILAGGLLLVVGARLVPAVGFGTAQLPLARVEPARPEPARGRCDLTDGRPAVASIAPQSRPAQPIERSRATGRLRDRAHGARDKELRMRPSSRFGAVTAVPSGLPLEPLLGTSVRVHPFQFDPTFPVDVRLVRWPMEATYRDDLHAVGVPRILIIDSDVAAPPRWDELEDWVRVPVDLSELDVRATTVAHRADALEVPWLDDDGMLWLRDRWCPVSRGQLPLVRLLVDRFGAVVRDDEVDAVFASGKTSAHEQAIKTTVRRVTQTVAPLGLGLQRLRASGYLLDRLP